MRVFFAKGGNSMDTTVAISSHHVLNSWKEIARYLDRGVRTAQRWEVDLALPVRRPRGKQRSAVVAICGDIDAWMQHCPLAAKKWEQPDHQEAVTDLISQSRHLRLELHRIKGELHETVDRLTANLGRMQA
jgi:hypothetical protein